MELASKNGEVVIYAKTIEDEALKQIYAVANSPLGESANIRIMPDCHSGAGCVIGTTMKIIDKVCPNLVGVDIGCGVDFVSTNIKFEDRLGELDFVIKRCVPSGHSAWPTNKEWDFTKLRCWDKLKDRTKELAYRSLGTLGGGNHFIEAYLGGTISVHSGSRNIGLQVATYYQSLAETRIGEEARRYVTEGLAKIEPAQRERYLAANKAPIDKELSYLTGSDMEDYLWDVQIMQNFAADNRRAIIENIVSAMEGKIVDHISSVHNYIEVEARVLRKGAISAKEGELLVIPLNMRDGLLLCKGKGNAEWNQSAPHGAGRLYSRSKAKQAFTLEEYKESMKGIYSSSISDSTLDEAPFAYKDYHEIIECVEPTVEIIKRYVPIFNFKAQ